MKNEILKEIKNAHNPIFRPFSAIFDHFRPFSAFLDAFKISYSSLHNPNRLSEVIIHSNWLYLKIFVNFQNTR